MGAVIFSFIGIIVATQLGADEITYTPSNTNFNVSTVEGTLNWLYSMAPHEEYIINDPITPTYNNKY